MSMYMNCIGNDQVEVNDGTDSGSEEEDPGEIGFSVGSGVYSVRMRLHCDLPKFIPMCGKRIRLWYVLLFKQPD